MQRNPIGFIENLCKMFFQMPSCTYIWLTLSLLHTGKAYEMTKMTAKKNLPKKINYESKFKFKLMFQRKMIN